MADNDHDDIDVLPSRLPFPIWWMLGRGFITQRLIFQHMQKKVITSNPNPT